MSDKFVCKRYLKVAFATTAPREAIFTRLRCKQWSCPACAKLNQAMWRKWLIKRLPEVSDEWWLLTMTAHSERRSAAWSMDSIRSNLDVFFKRLKRIMPTIQYARVYEKHPTSQAIHVHFIICGIEPFVAFGYSVKHKPMAIGTTTRRGRDGTWSVKTWVKKNAQELHMGYIADIRRIFGPPELAVLYLTKYLTKAQAELDFPYLRHVQVTTGIGSPPKEGKEWDWVTASYIIASMFPAGTKILDVNTGFTVDNNHWERTNFYPDDI